jgi:hypothetical protein
MSLMTWSIWLGDAAAVAARTSPAAPAINAQQVEIPKAKLARRTRWVWVPNFITSSGHLSVKGTGFDLDQAS